MLAFLCCYRHCDFASRYRVLIVRCIDFPRWPRGCETELSGTHLYSFERREHPGELDILRKDSREQLQVRRLYSMSALRIAKWHADFDGSVGLPSDLAMVDHNEPAAGAATFVRELHKFLCSGANDIWQLAGGRMPGRR